MLIHCGSVSDKKPENLTVSYYRVYSTASERSPPTTADMCDEY